MKEKIATWRYYPFVENIEWIIQNDTLENYGNRSRGIDAFLFVAALFIYTYKSADKEPQGD